MRLKKALNVPDIVIFSFVRAAQVMLSERIVMGNLRVPLQENDQLGDILDCEPYCSKDY